MIDDDFGGGVFGDEIPAEPEEEETEEETI